MDAGQKPTAQMTLTAMRVGQPLDDFLRDAYIRRGLSIKQIATDIDVDPATVQRWLRRWGIQARPAGRHTRTAS